MVTNQLNKMQARHLPPRYRACGVLRQHGELSLGIGVYEVESEGPSVGFGAR